MGDENQDPGEPIAELRDLSHETGPDFFHRLRRRIERRSLASSFMDVVWLAPVLILVEFVGMVFQLFGGGGERRGEK